MNRSELKEPMTHVFLKPCGCLSCAILNMPERFGELAKAQLYAQNHGEIYELMGTQAVREMAWKCPQHTESKQTILEATDD